MAPARSAHRLRSLVVALAGTGLLAACSAPGGPVATASHALPAEDDTPADVTSDEQDGASGTSSAPETGEAPATSEAAPAQPLSAKEVLGLVGPSVAFIGTEWATGTALAIDDGYLVTNAHIVVPFDHVDVTPPGGRTQYDVPVVGVDFDADLALIGPLDDPMPPIPYVVDPLVESGDEVFLVGYPSETEASPDPTISQGIVSRFRDVPLFDQHFIQTDADIAGGQSGGALVDGHGQVIGVSGLSLDEAFALALDFDDVLARLDSLRAGGQPWTPLGNAGDTSVELELPMHLSTAQLELPWSAASQDVELSVGGVDPSQVGLEIFLDDGTYLTSRSMVPVSAQWRGVTVEDRLADVGAQYVLDPDPTSGRYRFTLPAYQRAVIYLVRTTPGDGVPIDVQANRRMMLVDDVDDGAPLAVGDTVRGIIEPLEIQDRYTIDLVAGQRIDLRAESAGGDMEFYVLEPGATFGPDTFYAGDSNIGIGGLDAEAVFTATVDGTYQIVVWDNFGQAGYALTAEPA
ncbi:MAG: serine protease [Acidimicrobiales bacterium]